MRAPKAAQPTPKGAVSYCMNNGAVEDFNYNRPLKTWGPAPPRTPGWWSGTHGCCSSQDGGCPTGGARRGVPDGGVPDGGLPDGRARRARPERALPARQPVTPTASSMPNQARRGTSAAWVHALGKRGAASGASHQNAGQDAQQTVKPEALPHIFQNTLCGIRLWQTASGSSLARGAPCLYTEESVGWAAMGAGKWGNGEMGKADRLSELSENTL